MSEKQEKGRCDNCAHWSKGYRLQGFKVPSFCDRHNHTAYGDDPACSEHKPAQEIDP